MAVEVVAVKLSVCIEMIGKEVPFLERIALAAEAGYNAIEFWSWANKDIDAIAAAAMASNVTVAGMVATSGKLVDPSLRDRLVEEVKSTIEVAKRLSCTTLIVTTGNELPDMPRAQQHDSVVAGLKKVAPLAEQAGMVLVLEPLNLLVDHQGYYLSTSPEGFDIIRQVDSPAVRLLFDVYHQQVTEGNVTANMLANLDLIGHVHVADVPGRHEPGTGELNYGNICRMLSDAGYDGYVGLEFKPTRPSQEVLRSVYELCRPI
jgi:hydroxypyruvate isomerase